MPTNYLEALLFQQIEQHRKLSYLSATRLFKIIQSEHQIPVQEIHADSETKALYQQLKKLNNNIFDLDTEISWHMLLDKLIKENNTQSLQTIGRLIKVLHSFDLVPFWLHSNMANRIEALGSDPTSDALNESISAWVKEGQKSPKKFALIKDLQEQVVAFDTERFADPSQFEDAWKALINLKNRFMSDSFTAIFDAQKSDEKLPLISAITAMQNFVDLFDRSIKAMKGSNLWSKEQQPALFQQMLKEYLDLLKSWVDKLPQDIKKLLEHRFSTAHEYLSMFNKSIAKEFTLSDLEPSPNIDTSPFAMGAGFDWVNDSKREELKTGDDTFSVIHQSLLNLIASLNSACDIASVKTPKLIKDIFGIFKKVYPSIKLTGMQFTKNGVSCFYNIPLGSHGLRLVLTYQRKTKSVLLYFNFSGGNDVETYRWVNAAALFSGYHVHKFVDTNITKLGIHALSFEVTASNSNLPHIEELVTLLEETVCTGAEKSLQRILSGKKFVERNFDRQRFDAMVKMVNHFGELGTSVESILSFFVPMFASTLDSDALLKLADYLYELNDFSSAIELYATLVKRGHGNDAIEKVAYDSIERGYFEGIEIYKAFLERGERHNDVLKAAKVCGQQRKTVRMSFALYKMLAEYGVMHNDSIVNKILVSIHCICLKGFGQPYVQDIYEIHDIFIQKGFIKEVLMSTDMLLGTGCDTDLIYNSLTQKAFDYLKNDANYEYCFKIAGALFSSVYFRRMDDAFSIYKALLSRQYGHKEISKIALLAQVEGYPKNEYGLRLYKVLVENNQVESNEVLDAASDAFMSDDSSIKEIGIELFKALFAKGLGYDKALEVAHDACLKNVICQSDSLRLYNILIEKGQTIEVLKSLESMLEQRQKKPSLERLYVRLKNGIMSKD